ncbi:MAG: hypothetical protein IJ125_07680 [Atopobiaceae bacterium]|nr:hypothetical protein [Atopobiaceae bacterium]
MKITTFDPVIVTNRPDEVLPVFEKFGFEKKHSPTVKGPSGYEATDNRMKTENGMTMDVIAIDPNLPLEKEILAIRMNVDDFEEAYQMLTDLGFKPSHEGAITETDYAKGVGMLSPIGFNIYLIQHKKED